MSQKIKFLPTVHKKTRIEQELRLMTCEEKKRVGHKIKNFVYLIISGWLGSLSMSVSLFVSPLVIGFCRRKSTRLTAVIGGLVTALGCLFTSFASQFHQLFFSYGAMIGKSTGANSNWQ